MGRGQQKHSAAPQNTINITALIFCVSRVNTFVHQSLGNRDRLSQEEDCPATIHGLELSFVRTMMKEKFPQ